MAQKFLVGPIVDTTVSRSMLMFHVYFSFCTCIQSEFTSGVKDVTFVLIYI